METTRRIAHLSLLPVLGALLMMAGCSDAELPTAGEPFEDAVTAEGPKLPGGEPLKVLSRNMYLGGRVSIVFGADFNNPAEVVAAATEVWGQIQFTNFPERAKALAAEIGEARPHVVGIQEIPQYVVLAPSPTGAPPAVVEVQDHLQILMEELDGLPYSVAGVQTNAQATLPVMMESGLHYVQYTDRIAVLVRDDLADPVVDSGNYAAQFDLNEHLTLIRGWIKVSTTFAGVPYHFVNTHLEVQDFAPIQFGQTQELLNSITAGLDGVTVLMGDLNSDAEAGPGAPSWTPTYGALLAAGFQDSWEIDHPGNSDIGFTCCQDDVLVNRSSILDERIDFILLRAEGNRGSENRIPGSIHVDILGRDPGDWTYPSALWPSDHAGLLASIKIPPALFKNH